MTPRLPLAGIRVADMTTVVFGPYCTHMLADLGADVIKIEPSEGDVARFIGTTSQSPGMGPLHMRLNRGKVCWDLRSEAGQQSLQSLLKTCDVFIHNIRPEAVKRLGLDYEAVKALHPDIVYVHCTGFGLGGPYAGLQAYDDIIQAASGTATFMSRVDGDPAPRYIPALLADKVSGLYAAYATLAAVISRLRDGRGQQVEVPMFESVCSFNLVEHLYDQTFDPPTGDWGYPRLFDVARYPMRTLDGYVAITPYSDDRWVRFLEVAGRQDLLQTPEFRDPASRRANVSRMYDLARVFTSDKTTADCLQILKDAQIPAIKVNEIDELLQNPHLSSVDFFKPRQHPTEGRYVEVRPPVRFSAFEYPEFEHAPTLGQHTQEVDDELATKAAAPGRHRVS